MAADRAAGLRAWRHLVVVLIDREIDQLAPET